MWLSAGSLGLHRPIGATFVRRWRRPQLSAQHRLVAYFPDASSPDWYGAGFYEGAAVAAARVAAVVAVAA